MLENESKQLDKKINVLSKGLSVEDLFIDGGLIFEIKAINEDGTYNSVRVKEKKYTDDEEQVETTDITEVAIEEVKAKETIESIPPDASEKLPEQIEPKKDLHDMTFAELKELAVSVGLKFRVGQGRLDLINAIKETVK